MTPRRMLLAAGSNAQGQLGIGSYDDAHMFTPCRFSFESQTMTSDPDQLDLGVAGMDVARIACGANHTVVLLCNPNANTDTDLEGGSTTKARTSLWGAGDGRRGQLGVGWGPCGNSSSDPWTTFRPLVLGHPYAVKDVAAAWETTYVVCACEGRGDVVLAMGSGEFGALGAGAGASRLVGFDHLFEHLPERPSVRALYAGPRHVVAELVVYTHTDTDGTSTTAETLLVGWGASRHGQLGPGAAHTRFVAQPTCLPIPVDAGPVVSCALGSRHTIVLHASGQLTTFGSNAQGQIPALGEGVRVCELGCTWNGTYVRTEARRLIAAGSDAQGQLGRGVGASGGGVVSLPDDCALSRFVCGSEHVLARMSRASREDSVVGWGWNEHGNMGVGSRDNVTIPTQLWPGSIEMYKEYPKKVIGVWAGCATSWLLVE